jgi:hypothetical protein
MTEQRPPQQKGEGSDGGPLFNQGQTAGDVAEPQNRAEQRPRQRLARIGTTTLFVSNHDRPWTLPLDGLVVPTDSRGTIGRMGKAVGRDYPPLLERFQGALTASGSGRDYVVLPSAPVAVELPTSDQGFNPRYLIAATAWPPEPGSSVPTTRESSG